MDKARLLFEAHLRREDYGRVGRGHEVHRSWIYKLLRPLPGEGRGGTRCPGRGDPSLADEDG